MLGKFSSQWWMVSTASYLLDWVTLGFISWTYCQWPCQAPKLKVPTIHKAYVREYSHKILHYMVQYLHFRILEFPLILSYIDNDSVHWTDSWIFWMETFFPKFWCSNPHVPSACCSHQSINDVPNFRLSTATYPVVASVFKVKAIFLSSFNQTSALQHPVFPPEGTDPQCGTPEG